MKPCFHAAKLALVLALLLCHARRVDGRDTTAATRARHGRLLLQRSVVCRGADGPCAGAAEAGDESCVPRCVSPSCHDLIYGADPLEEGEVDVRRASMYNRCAVKEMGEARRAGLRMDEWRPFWAAAKERDQGHNDSDGDRQLESEL
jgi:Domain of unknown function (DUF4787)